MAWEPSLGAFYGPAAFIALVTCVHFLGAHVQLRRHPERRHELRGRAEEQHRPPGPEATHSPRAPPGRPPASLLQNEHSLEAQLRAAAFTLFLFVATWAFGALAVSQGPFLDMVFSCLYGAFCVTLGLFVLIHHCAKRDDVWHCWWSCCPARRGAHPALDANGDALGRAACLQDLPGPGQPRGFGRPPAGPCKMTNLQAAQSHVSCLSPAAPCCAQRHCEQLLEDAVQARGEDPCGHDPRLHRRLQGRTKPHYFGRHLAAAAEQEYAYHIPSSLDGSPHSSGTDSPPSSLEGPGGDAQPGLLRPGRPLPLGQPARGWPHQPHTLRLRPAAGQGGSPGPRPLRDAAEDTVPALRGPRPERDAQGQPV